MKWIYILIVLVVMSLASGCVDKEKDKTSVQTPVSPGEAAITPVSTSSVGSQTSSNDEDLFGTESNLSAIDTTLIDTTFNDMDTEITLLDSV